MSYAKDSKRVRINSGDNDGFYFGSAWNYLGFCESGTINDNQDTAELSTKAGYVIERRAKEKCWVDFVLAQTSKEELELPDVIGDSEIPLFIDNGIVNSYYQEFYFPAISVTKQVKLEMKGNAFQTFGIKFSALPQAALASVDADDLPSWSAAYEAPTEAPDAVTTHTGKNVYYVILETAVTPDLAQLMAKINKNIADSASLPLDQQKKNIEMRRKWKADYLAAKRAATQNKNKTAVTDATVDVNKK